MLWLLDICVDVSDSCNINRVTAQNLAIVIARNLYYANDLEPLQQLMQLQKVANFLHKGILWRNRTRPDEVKNRFMLGSIGAAPHDGVQSVNGARHEANAQSLPTAS